MIYDNILVAFDGSKAANKALDTSIQIAKSCTEIKLTVIHVTSRPSFVLAGYGIVIAESYEEEIQKQQKEIVCQAKERIQNLPHAKVIVQQGTPSYVILEYAEDQDCDLIVLGNRGLGPIREWMLGSVSHHITQQSHIPVLVVK